MPRNWIRPCGTGCWQRSLCTSRCGFEGLKYWSWDYNLSLLLGTVALGIVVLLALTSVDRIVSAMGLAWKRLHRGVAVSLTGAAREWAIWPLFVVSCGAAYWSHFLIRHHRH